MKHRYFRLTFLCLALALTLPIVAQNVGINDDNSTPDANAMLDVNSTTKGALFPRMTTAQRTTLGNLNPTEGMLVFDTEVESYFYFVNGAWAQLSTENGEHKVPVGNILVYAGHIDNIEDGGYNSTPYSPIEGYLLCNGAKIDVNMNPEYDSLKSVIQEYWGDCDDGLTSTVNLPDLRGLFLRGVNMNGSRDPEPTGLGRTPIHPGGADDNHVGSYQSDELGSHDHNYTNPQLPANPNLGVVSDGNGSTKEWPTHNGGTTTPSGGSETRPRNAYVHYIIKYSY